VIFIEKSELKIKQGSCWS